MTTPRIPLDALMDDLGRRLQSADSTARLEAMATYDRGVLLGYYLGGAISAAEYRHACDNHQLTRENRLALLSADEAWRQRERRFRHGDITR